MLQKTPTSLSQGLRKMDLMELAPKSEDIKVELTYPLNTNDFDLDDPESFKPKPITNEDGEQAYITIYSPYSREYKDVEYQIKDRRISKARKAAKEGKPFDIGVKEQEQEELELIASVTKDWNISIDGKTDVNKENALEVYTKVPYIYGLVLSERNDYLNFIKL